MHRGAVASWSHCLQLIVYATENCTTVSGLTGWIKWTKRNMLANKVVKCCYQYSTIEHHNVVMPVQIFYYNMTLLHHGTILPLPLRKEVPIHWNTLDMYFSAYYWSITRLQKSLEYLWWITNIQQLHDVRCVELNPGNESTDKKVLYMANLSSDLSDFIGTSLRFCVHYYI